MTSLPFIPHIIGGEELPSVDNAEFDNVNPWTNECNSRVASGSSADARRAVESARTAFADGPWPRMSYTERGRLLHRLADLMEENREELARADTADMGRPIAGTRTLDVPRGVMNFRFYADHARLATSETYPMDDKHLAFTRYEPAGVVAAITPWNHPLMLGTWKIAAPLAWGNTVVHKPAEDTPTSAHLVGKLALEAGFPPGVLNILQGTGAGAGTALTTSENVDRLTFTGATATGRTISRAAADNLIPVSLELGGKGANLVFEDADLDAAVDWAAKAIFSNSGQVCLAASRIYVQRAVFEEFVDRMVTAADSMSVGDPMDQRTDLGPMASAKHFAKVKEYFDLVANEGGRLLTGGPGEGLSVRPAVVTGAEPSGRICREEIFGPMAVVAPFDTEDEAVRLANSTTYGLSALLFTQNLSRAHRLSSRLRAGTVWVNCYQVRDLRAPLGGPGDSGVGREGGLFSREFFTEPKAVVMAFG